MFTRPYIIQLFIIHKFEYFINNGQYCPYFKLCEIVVVNNGVKQSMFYLNIVC